MGWMRLSTRSSRSYRALMLLGGLLGAVSLALALAVTEQAAIPHESRQFIAVAATGFVLMTLFVNGLSLRPLIERLGLNRLSAVARALRDQVEFIELESLRDKADELARNVHIGTAVLEPIHAALSYSQASVGTAQTDTHRE